MSKAKGRGSNPNSHRNKPKLGVEAGEITLTPAQWEFVFHLGEGNKSKGVRSLINWSITFWDYIMVFKCLEKLEIKDRCCIYKSVNDLVRENLPHVISKDSIIIERDKLPKHLQDYFMQALSEFLLNSER